MAKLITKLITLSISAMLPILAAAEVQFPKITTMIGEQEYTLEVAMNVAAYKQGLMGRTELRSNEGMLFIFAQEDHYKVWMKNTLIPLNVYWIDADQRVTHHRRLDPCDEEDCQSVTSPEKSLYLLELNNEEHAIQVGDVLRLPRLNKR